jgi:2-methylcitrate dehydratase PrpD
MIMKDGRRFSKHVDHPRGEPENPFMEQDHKEKLTLMASSLGMRPAQIEELYQTLSRVEELDDISELTRLLVP